MTLQTRVIARISDQRLVELTNSKNRAATTVDATLLAEVVADVEAEFQINAGVSYDDTDDRHGMTCVHGVIYYLLLYKGVFNQELTSAEERWNKLLLNTAKVQGRNRISPTTSSVLVPSSEAVEGATTRPDTDRPNFRNLVPGPPGRGPNFGDLTSREDV